MKIFNLFLAREQGTKWGDFDNDCVLFFYKYVNYRNPQNITKSKILVLLEYIMCGQPMAAYDAGIIEMRE